MLIRAGSTPVTRTNKRHTRGVASGMPIVYVDNLGRKPLEGASPRGFRWAHFKYSQAIRENRSTPQSPATALPAPNTTTPRVYVIAAGGLHTRLRRDLLTQDHSSASINTLINEKPVVPAIQIISGRRRRSPFL